jgi:hygromycin-B 7''-O-kinase
MSRSYAIMPRMPGLQLADDNAREKSLLKEERHAIARAMGKNLALMQEVTWAFSGQYDAERETIRPFDSSYANWITQRILCLLARSREHSDRTTADDSRWVEGLLGEAQEALNEPFQPCFVMHDYKEANVVVEYKDRQWRVSGVFDFLHL